MSKRTDTNHIWYLDLSPQSGAKDKIFKAFKHNNISLQQWNRSTETEFGFILIDGNNSYEHLISILNIQIKNQGNRVVVINTSNERINSDAVFKILNYGAEYFFESSSINDDFECIVEKFQRWKSIEIILNAPTITRSIIGEGNTLKKLLRGIIEVAVYSDMPVLIQGERGTGKELIAKLIHDLDRKRSNNTLVLIDCSTIRPELSGSEFFGHEKGSYTGADNTRDGAFALANNGTLFLDEVGETPLRMQAELLRIIQEGVYKKLGSNIWKQTNFRLVCATNRDLCIESENGTFRKDLYDRISTWKCYMPSLSERRADIPLLANFFFRQRFPESIPVIDDNVIDYLKEREYPGNIRELKNLITRICLKYTGKGAITLGDIPEQDRTTYFRSKVFWYENDTFIDKITEALKDGYDAKSITDTVKSVITKIALATTTNNREVSQLLGKSERWIQLQKAKEK